MRNLGVIIQATGLVIFFIFNLVACGGDEPQADNPALQELHEYRAIWQQLSPENFSYVTYNNGTCVACLGPGIDTRYFVEQSPGSLTKRYVPGDNYYSATGNIEQDVKTIDDLFNDLESKLAIAPDLYAVEYHPEYGFPERIEESSVVIARIGYFTVGETQTREYFSHLIQWHDLALTNFQYSFNADCDCPVPDDTKVSIENGVLVRVVPEQRDTEYGMRSNRNGQIFIGDIFDRIQSMIYYDRAFSVVYDSTYHIPTEITWRSEQDSQTDQMIQVMNFAVGNTEVEDELALQRERWLANAPQKYRYKYSVGLTASVDAHYQFMVDNGEIVETLYYDWSGDLVPMEQWIEPPRTIGDVFDIIEYNLTAEAGSRGLPEGFYVQYSPEFGYPELLVDQNTIPADDAEVFYVIKDFEVLD